MVIIDDLCISLHWGGQSAPLDYPSSSDFINEIAGQVMGENEQGDQILIGMFKLYSIDVAAAFNDNISIYDIFDQYSETEIFYDSIFDDNEPDLSPELAKLMDCSDRIDNILIMDRLEILPQFRGKSIGLMALWKIIHHFARSAGLVVLKPYPLQFEHEAMDKVTQSWRDQMQLIQFDTDISIATAKLERLYQRLGFVTVEKSAFMVRSNEKQLPKIAMGSI